MAAGIPVNLTRLSPTQQAIVNAKARFNIIAGGIESGKTTLADDVVLSKAMTTKKATVAYVFPEDGVSLDAAKMRLFLRVSKYMASKPNRGRIELQNGSVILLMEVKDGRIELFEHISLMVIDDAPSIPGFYSVWSAVLRPHLDNTRADGWIFGKPEGAKEGFGRLFREAQGLHDWQAVNMPTLARLRPIMEHEGEAARMADAEANATLPAAVAKAEEEMDPAAFAQEYLGEVLDEPIVLTLSQSIIGRDETFLQWCDRLAADGLMVDEQPFRLDNRPTMRWIYSRIPSTPEEAFGKQLVLMKCTQVGFTVMEMLATIYLALKFSPCKIGMYMPDQNLAAIKSSERFMPIVRTIPAVYDLLLKNPTGTKKTGEGNVMIRNMGRSRFHFFWTSGKGATESVPLDVVSFDEVQEMAIPDMEKTKERMSASSIRYTLMGSTANWPDRDIHFFYKKGTQHQFWTQCPECGDHQILDDHFPSCVRLRDGDYRYVCHKPECDAVIHDPQAGEWRPANPDAQYESIHYPQFLSPTISPREMIEAYFNADDMKNFFNRKRGKPYLDPTQVPVDLEMLNDCARLGMEMGVEWKQRASGTFMGIDQMGNYNVALIAERLPSGHMAIIHAEEIYSADPFMRCSELMEIYGVTVCCVETNPNYNDAKRFANRHPGRVFLANYGNMADDMMRWGDAVPNRQERKTSEEDRDRYTVSIDQYKCMQVAMKRITNKVCVFPDPMGLVQEVKDKGLQHVVPILKDRVFLHFTRTALIAEQDEEEKKFRRRVVKVGIDPHFSYAYMLLNVAWARSHGTTMFLNPLDRDDPRDAVVVSVEQQMPGLPSNVLQMLELPQGTCGRCLCYDNGTCTDRGFLVGASDPGCPIFVENTDGL